MIPAPLTLSAKAHRTPESPISHFMEMALANPNLISLAYAFEQATQVRVPPDFIPTIGDDASASRQPSSHEKQKPSSQKKQTAAVVGRSGTWRMPPLR
jgi:hypothetical protein